MGAKKNGLAAYHGPALGGLRCLLKIEDQQSSTGNPARCIGAD
jgi:hypothetical protein